MSGDFIGERKQLLLITLSLMKELQGTIIITG